MESPLLTYKSLLNVHNIKDIAYDTLFTKYIVRNDKADKKLSEIDSTDQESLILHLNGGYPIPGMIYTFIYKPSLIETVTIKNGKAEKKYKDKVPLVLCTKHDKGMFSGINMNTLPCLERLKLLEEFYKKFKPFFMHVENLTQNRKIAINKEYIEIVKSHKGQLLMKAFGTMANSNFNYGYRNYDMKNVIRLRMIEFSEWDYIPHFEPKDAFALMNHAQIHNLYYRNK